MNKSVINENKIMDQNDSIEINYNNTCNFSGLDHLSRLHVSVDSDDIYKCKKDIRIYGLPRV